MPESQVLAGLTVIITAGPTREAIDPVRFISNRSSGKMGFAVARAAADAGATVVLVAGPVSLRTPDNIERIEVQSANDMQGAVHERIGSAHVLIAAAAVADYRPVERATRKIKKSGDTMNLHLVKTPDVLAGVAALENGPFCVGFAAETNDLEANALKKLKKKNLDMIAANLVGDEKGFDSDENALTVYWHGGQEILPAATKQRLAEQLVELIGRRYWSSRSGGESGES